MVGVMTCLIICTLSPKMRNGLKKPYSLVLSDNEALKSNTL